ncbi:peptide deformylase, partial [Candidatus Pelagibacter sp.]|nr:peptide deformylase [Candidatus Pelagibacter sp.]
MSIKDIITVPDEMLKKISEPIEKIGTNEKKLIKDLFDTMYASNGIGLAAVQIGVLKRILVIDVSAKDEPKKPLSLINPIIKKLSDDTSIYEEGCLSIPETFIEIERPKICEIEYIDSNGFKKELKCDGLMSTCIQHEINHLDGKLIIDHL